MRRVWSQTTLVRYRFVGVHSWPDAPDSCGHMRSPHQHAFTVILALADDVPAGDVSIAIERSIEGLFGQGRRSDKAPMPMGDWSARRLAAALLEVFADDGARWCVVWEDDLSAGRADLRIEEEEEEGEEEEEEP